LCATRVLRTQKNWPDRVSLNFNVLMKHFCRASCPRPQRPVEFFSSPAVQNWQHQATERTATPVQSIS
jgi:hypothetical protein